jgi:hypothetical protein
MYTKSLQFPLGVTMMSYNTLNNISKRTTRAVIGAMHVNRSLPCILAFSGTKLHRPGLRHHYCAQGIAHIKQVIQHTRQQDENGKMYKIIIDYGQLLAGVHYPILQYPKPKLPHIKDPLITTIRQFLADSQLNIVIPGIYLPQPLCGNDLNIMSEILKIKNSPIAIKRVNQFHLFLQVTWLSEMTDPQGNTILPEFLNFKGTHTDVSRSNLRWPVQALPPLKSWEIWKKLIRKQFLLSKQGRLGTAITAHGAGSKQESIRLLKTHICLEITSKSTTQPN